MAAEGLPTQGSVPARVANLVCKKALKLGWVHLKMGWICRRMGFLGGDIRLSWMQRAARHFRAAGAYYDLEIIENDLEEHGGGNEEMDGEVESRVLCMNEKYIFISRECQ